MQFVKKYSLALLGLTSLLLSACQSTPANNISLNAPSPTNTSFSTNNQNAIVNVVTKDGRAQPEISAYTFNDKLLKLNAKPELVNLLQQVMQQNLNSKGFRLGEFKQANTGVLVTIKEFYAKVDEGNLRYKISSKAQIEVYVQGAKGNFTKTLGTSRVDEGVFGVNNDNIKKSLDVLLRELTTSIYQDQEIGNAIRQYSN